MKQKYIILGILILSILLYLAWVELKNQSPQADTDTKRPAENSLPTTEIANDKLVIVDDINETDIKRILQEFCNSYNKKAYQAIPRMIKLSENKYAVTFPFDINFDIFCFFINYVNYPVGFDRQFNATGWTTTKPNDIWIKEKIANKKVMLFVSEYDTEYDNVFLTTSENIGYKLGFALGEESQPLDKPEKNYVMQPIDFSEIENYPHFDYK